MRFRTQLGWRVAGVLVALGLGLPVHASAQVQPDGIKVHGHWVIEVRNADGTVAETREFDNALTGSGKQQLVEVMGRAHMMGYWQIILYMSANSGPCVNNGNPNACFIIEPGSPFPARSDIFKNLTLALSAATGEITLQGSAVVGMDGDVGSVQTYIETPSPGATFTNATLQPAVTVQAGQTVAVTVTLSFS